MSDVTETQPMLLDKVAAEIAPVNQKKAAPAPVNSAIELKDGVMRATSIEAQYRLADAMMKGGMVPKAYDRPEKVMAGMQFASELGLPALSGLRQIALIHGTPSLFGDLPLALCYSKKLVEFHDEFLFDENYERISFENKNLNKAPHGAFCVMKRKNGSEHKATFTVEDAKTASLWKKQGPWTQYPKRMLALRARSLCLKNLFPDALMGAAIAEYDFNDVAPTALDGGTEMKDVTNTQNEALLALQPKGSPQ